MGAAADTGAMLKDARVKAGRTLEDLARETRIHIKFLTELEEGAGFSLTPIYRKTFLRTYARALGLDPDDLPADEPPAPPVAAETPRRSVLADLPDVPPVEMGVATPVSRNPFAEKTQIRTMIVVVVLLVTALVMSVKWLGSGEGGPGASPMPSQNGDSLRGAGGLPALARDSAGALKAGRIGAADSLMLQATTVESVWVHVVIDNDSTVEYHPSPDVFAHPQGQGQLPPRGRKSRRPFDIAERTEAGRARGREPSPEEHLPLEKIPCRLRPRG